MAMNLERSLFAAFKPIKQPDETIYWAGRPHFFFFVCPSFGLLVFGLFWLRLPYGLLSRRSFRKHRIARLWVDLSPGTPVLSLPCSEEIASVQEDGVCDNGPAHFDP